MGQEPVQIWKNLLLSILIFDEFGGKRSKIRVKTPNS